MDVEAIGNMGHARLESFAKGLAKHQDKIDRIEEEGARFGKNIGAFGAALLGTGFLRGRGSIGKFKAGSPLEGYDQAAVLGGLCLAVGIGATLMGRSTWGEPLAFAGGGMVAGSLESWAETKGQTSKSKTASAGAASYGPHLLGQGTSHDLSPDRGLEIILEARRQGRVLGRISAIRRPNGSTPPANRGDRALGHYQDRGDSLPKNRNVHNERLRSTHPQPAPCFPCLLAPR